MSDDSLDLREQIARIDRMRDESDKFRAEQRKLIAEAGKLGRERWLAPWLAVVGLIGGVVAVVTLILHAIGKA
ncbi:MAG: hypothetical protein ABI369_10000 [Acetobacteraceae bacterium]